MHLSEHGFALIKNFEGLRLNAYKDVAGIWTIGYGSTRYSDGNVVKSGDKLTQQQAGELFHITMLQYEAAVNNHVKVKLTQNQFDALVCFAYNAGTGALAGSTLLKKLNMGNYAGAADGLLAWNKITDPHTNQKVVCDTLVHRRKQERELFLTPTP